MTPYPNFKFSNAVLQPPKGMDNCEPLAIHRTHDGSRCVSCWKPSFNERLSILFFGKVWLDIFSGMTQPPVAITGIKTYFKESK